MSDFLVRTIQFTLALIVVMASIWFQETYAYKINPFITAGWAFIVPYGLTLGYVRLADWRIRNGRVLPRLRRQ